MPVRSPAGPWKTTSRAGVPDGDRHGSDGPDRVQRTIVPHRLSALRNSMGVSLSVRYTSTPMIPTVGMSRLVELVAGNPSRTKSGLQARAAPGEPALAVRGESAERSQERDVGGPNWGMGLPVHELAPDSPGAPLGSRGISGPSKRNHARHAEGGGVEGAWRAARTCHERPAGGC